MVEDIHGSCYGRSHQVAYRFFLSCVLFLFLCSVYLYLNMSVEKHHLLYSIVFLESVNAFIPVCLQKGCSSTTRHIFDERGLAL